MSGVRTVCFITLVLSVAACVLGPKQDDPVSAPGQQSDRDGGLSIDATATPSSDSGSGTGRGAGDSEGLKDDCDQADADGGGDARCVGDAAPDAARDSAGDGNDATRSD